jgi:hypothetical protein
MTAIGGEYWVVSAPGEQTAQEAFDRLNHAVSNITPVNRFNIPDLKVGDDCCREQIGWIL